MHYSEEVKNRALSLSMEFGKFWLMDIQERLSKEFPRLSPANLNSLNKTCKGINKLAQDFIRNNPVKKENEINFMPFERFQKYLVKNHPWISHENVTKLYSQSCYYARK